MVGFYCARDVPGSNMIGPVWTDEEVFATTEVTCVGQVRVRAGVRAGVWAGGRAVRRTARVVDGVPR